MRLELLMLLAPGIKKRGGGKEDEQVIKSM